MLARKYLQERELLKPDARYMSFLGGMMMAEGNIHNDQRLVRKGFFTMLRSIRAYP